MQERANILFLFFLQAGFFFLWIHLAHVLYVHVKNCRDTDFEPQVDEEDQE